MQKLLPLLTLIIFASCTKKNEEEIIKTNKQQVIDLDKANASFDKSWRDLS
jgi:hypothetical protein